MTLYEQFPLLLSTAWRVTSPETEEYNCIAWAADDSESWWWPDPKGFAYWPPNVPREVTITAFILAYATKGYTPCQDGDFEAGYEKIALYVDAMDRPTHAAKQISNGMWSSKLGKWHDIEHTLEGLVGPEYGRFRIFMRRAIRA